MILKMKMKVFCKLYFNIFMKNINVYKIDCQPTSRDSFCDFSSINHKRIQLVSYTCFCLYSLNKVINFVLKSALQYRDPKMFQFQITKNFYYLNVNKKCPSSSRKAKLFCDALRRKTSTNIVGLNTKLRATYLKLGLGVR
jgi:hypothetical protein